MRCCEAWKPIEECFDTLSFECLDFQRPSQIFASLTRENLGTREAEVSTLPWTHTALDHRTPLAGPSLRPHEIRNHDLETRLPFGITSTTPGVQRQGRPLPHAPVCGTEPSHDPPLLSSSSVSSTSWPSIKVSLVLLAPLSRCAMVRALQWKLTRQRGHTPSRTNRAACLRTP